MVRRKEPRRNSPGPSPEDDIGNADTSGGAEHLVDEDNEDLLNMYIPERPQHTVSNDPNEARLIITHIVVENFKSYYGKKVLGPFHKNYTSILGPNGSGKSNVIDSMLFVFGFRANKIRSKKLSVLIHKSAAHPNVSSASVSVHFARIWDRGPHDYETKPNSQFSVTRTVNSDGSSRYYFNKKGIKPDELRSMLKENGIDLDHNRFLILQGEVEQISLMKPKGDDKGEEGMLEYLEDIIGSNRLKVPIEKLGRRTEKLDEHLKTIVSRRNLAAKEHTDLIEPLVQLFKVLRLENAITKCNNQLYHIEKKRIKDAAADVETQYKALKEGQDKYLKEKSKIQKELSHLKSKVSSLQHKENDLKDEKERAEEAKRKESDSIRLAQNDMQRAEDKLKKLNRTLVKENKNLAELEEAPEKAKEIVAEIESQLGELKENVANREQQFHEKQKEANEANVKARAKLEEIMPQMRQLKNEEEGAQTKLTLATDKLNKLKDIMDRPQRELDQALENLHNTEVELENHKHSHENLLEQKPVLETEAEQEKEQFRRKKALEERLLAEVGKLNQEVDAQERDTNFTTNQVVSALLREKQANNLPGLYGRLGDLGGIDDKYDVAISTCCPALDYVVVDTVDTAKKSIEFLKRKNLMRTTFIALEKQQGFWTKINAKPATPENAPRLFDLVNVMDEDVKPAFYYALKETLVANDVDQAARISNVNGRRNRVVTLQGDVIEAFGTLSGGGKSQRRGRMGKQARIDTTRRKSVNLTQLKSDLESKRMELAQLRRALQMLEAGIQSKQDTLTQISDSLGQNQFKKTNLERKVAKLKEIVQHARSQLGRHETDQSKIGEVESEVQDLAEQKEKINRESTEIQEREKTVMLGIEETERRICGKAKEKLEQAKKDLKKAEQELKKATLTVNNSASVIERTKNNIRSTEREIADVEKQMERSNTRLAKHEELVEKMVKQIEEIGEKLGNIAQDIARASDDTASLSARELEIDREMDESTRQVQVIEAQVRKHNHEMEQVDLKISKLQTFNVRHNLQHINTDHIASVLEETTAESAANETASNEQNVTGRRSRSTARTVKSEEDPDATLTEERTLTEEQLQERQAMDDTAGTATTSERSASRSSRRGRKARVKEEPVEPVALDESNVSTRRGRKKRTRKVDQDEEMTMENEDLNEEDAEDLPNTTAITNTEGDTTHEPAYDLGHLPMYSDGEVDAFDEAHVHSVLIRKQRQRERYPKEFNLELIQEYADKLEKFNSVDAQYNRVRTDFDAHRRMYDTLKKDRITEFQEGFQQICVSTQDTYKMLTMGGEAALELVDSMDPFSSGISYQVRPPKKTWKQITNLSGGEKTLASLALVFGLHSYRPTPFYVMDEIDAALDYRNVSIISTFVKERTKNAQFVIISLRNNMFENGDRLLGIYKVNDCTNNVIVTHDDQNTDPRSTNTKMTKSDEDLQADEGPPQKRRRALRNDQ